MWAAGICLLPLGLLGFAVGTLVLLASFQLVAAAASLRWQATARERLLIHLLGLLIWIVVVPVQVLLATSTGWSFPIGFLLLGALWMLLPLLPARVARRYSTS